MPGRNDPCPCGSGKKFKKCCAKQQAGVITDGITIHSLVSLLEQGDLASAIQYGAQLLAAEPRNPDLLEILAVAYYQAGQPGKACEYFSLQLEVQADNVQAMINLAQVLLETGDASKALPYAEQATRKTPGMAAAQNTLGNVYRALGELEAATNSYSKAISLESDNPLYLCNLGVVEQELEEYESAEKHLNSAIIIAPEFIEAIINYAAVLQKQKKYDEALNVYENALLLNIQDAEILNNMGVCWREKNNPALAKQYYQKSLDVNSEQSDVYVNLALLEEKNNQLDEALELYKKSIQLDENNAVAYCYMGMILMRLGYFAEAVSAYEKALGLQEDNGIAYAGLAEAALLEFNNEKAKQYLTKALAKDSKEPFVRLIKARLYESQDEIGSAIAEYKIVIENDKNGILARADLASLYYSTGDIDSAREQYEFLVKNNSPDYYIDWSIIEEKQNNIDEAERLLVCAIKEGKQCTAIAKIHLAKLEYRKKNYKKALQLLADVNEDSIFDSSRRYTMLFEKGKILDKLQEYKQAFDCFSRANEIKRQAIGYNCIENKDEYKIYRKIFQTKIQPVDITNKTVPIFIVGFPRSGTTLMEQILSSHSQVVAGDELGFIIAIAQKGGDISGLGEIYPGYIPQLSDKNKQCLRSEYLSSAEQQGLVKENTTYFTDKMPLNLTHLGLINILFPESPIIHMIRHPLDACFSSHIANFKRHRYSTSLEMTAEKFVRVMELAEFYKQNLDMKYMEVHYEDLVSDQEKWSREVIDFIGLDWEGSCLSFHENKRTARTASYEQVTQKIYTSSKFRYKNYYEQLKPVFPILEDTVKRFGYTIEP